MRPLFCVLFSLLFIPNLQASPFTDQVIESSVIVSSDTGYGSGTVIRHDGSLKILTAAHVVEGSETVLITSRLTRTLRVDREARVVARNEKDDLALLEVDDQDYLKAAHVFAVDDVELGEDAWYCGFGSGMSWNLQKTIINRDDHDWTTVNGMGWYGHSGSGLFVKRGDKWVLIGVVVRLQNPKNPKSPCHCVTRARIKKFLDGCSKPCCPTVPAPCCPPMPRAA